MIRNTYRRGLYNTWVCKFATIIREYAYVQIKDSQEFTSVRIMDIFFTVVSRDDNFVWVAKTKIFIRQLWTVDVFHKFTTYL